MTTKHRLGIDCWVIEAWHDHTDMDCEAAFTSEDDAKWYVNMRKKFHKDNRTYIIPEYYITHLKGGLIEQDKMP